MNSKDQYNQAREWHMLKRQVPLWLLISWGYASYFTDWSLIDDEYYERTRDT